MITELMEPKDVDFTARGLAKITCPATGRPDRSGRVWIADPDVRGLLCMITEAGSRIFYWRRRIRGRTETRKIGMMRYPGDVDGLSVEQARDAAAKFNDDKARGVNPGEVERQAKAEMTLGDAWEAFKVFTQDRKRPSSRKGDEYNYKRFLAAWKSRRLSSITRQDVEALHTRIGKKGPYLANRVLSLLTSIFNRAGAPTNPCRGVEKFKEHSRARFVQPDEMPRFLKALDEFPDENFRHFFWLLLLTGARRGNVQAMRWQDVSLDRRVWSIPPEAAKAGDRLDLPLVDKAVEILTARLATRKDENPWVFASYGETGHLVEIKTAWHRILTAAGIADLRPHDIRRSLGSWMAGGGASLLLVGKALGHKQTSTTEIYARLLLDPVRAAVDTATAAMMATTNPQAKAPRTRGQRKAG